MSSKFPLAALAALSLIVPSAASAAREPSPSQGYIVVYKASVDDVGAETDERERQGGFKSRFRYRRAVKGFAAKLNDRQVEALRQAVQP